ncbi:MAG TPA: universal stress protein [Longimicrobiaceae bacterium]|nr:universal stress protein [Longimicrobiaceae bacterium]
MDAVDGIRLDRVVTAVDFHESSRAAALWVMRHFAPAARHELVHVVDLPELPAPLRGLGADREELRLAAREGAQRRLDELAALGEGARVGTHVREGRPAREIVHLADELGADIVVVGQQGPTHGVRVLLGSTAERVLFRSPIPVLVARKVGGAPPRRLFAAVDPSDVADDVLAWTRALIEHFGATATLLSVVDRVLLADELTGLPTAEMLQRLVDEATPAMRSWLEAAIDRTGLERSAVEATVRVGDPTHEIIAGAARDGAQLLLLGSKGGDVARTTLIGRILNKVVRAAPCSVLVVTSGSGGGLQRTNRGEVSSDAEP